MCIRVPHLHEVVQLVILCLEAEAEVVEVLQVTEKRQRILDLKKGMMFYASKKCGDAESFDRGVKRCAG
jgi:hypothetical protein